MSTLTQGEAVLGTDEGMKLSCKEKIGYGFGDAASHIVFDNVMLYMMFFYTDVVGIPAAFVGSMFLLARVLDAVADPVMGHLADRTRTHWGQFRPFILFGAVPFAVACILVYTIPSFDMNGKMIFAAVTYTLLMVMYTFVNIPYCALGGVITSDDKERMSLQSYRFVLATAGGMLSTVLMVPMANYIGGSDKALGYQGSIAILAVLACLMLLLCFYSTKERVQVKQAYQSNFFSDIRELTKNDQWRIVAGFTFLNIMALSIRGGSMMYYVTYILGSASYFALFLGLYSVGSILGSAIAKKVTDKICKVKVYIFDNIILGSLSLLMFFVPTDSLPPMFVFMFVIGFFHRMTTPIQWVMMSDTVEYGERQGGRRITGISFAGILFVLKVGFACGGALIGWILSAVNYHAGVPIQSGDTVTGIIFIFTILPAVAYFLCALLGRSYKLNRAYLEQAAVDNAQIGEQH